MIKEIVEYLRYEIGAEITEHSFPEEQRKLLPRYLMKLPEHLISVNGKRVLLTEKINTGDTTPEQLEAYRNKIEEQFGMPLVFCPENLEPFERKRFIQKKLSFIVPGKQVYIPSLFISLNELRTVPAQVKQLLSPSAQCILLFHLQRQSIEGLSFSEIIELLQNYNLMTLSRAAKEFVSFGLGTVSGGKEKFLHFSQSGRDLWNAALPFMNSPVVKRLYSDVLPDEPVICISGDSALESYCGLLSPENKTIALVKGRYYKTKNDINGKESRFAGRHCLEVWSYQPDAAGKQKGICDPLSLYLCYQKSEDERVRAAINELAEKQLWSKD